MITLVSGIEGNKGLRLQQNFEAKVPFLEANWLISPIVRAPLEISVIDHSLLTSNLSPVGHLHHMHGYSPIAQPIPHTIARNFQSPPKYHSIL